MKKLSKNLKIVLVIEDEIDMRFYLMAMVKSLGHEAILTRNGIQGLDTLCKTRPDLIILDVMMPEKGGALVYQELKIDPLYRDIPLIVFSGVDPDSFIHYIKMLNMGQDAKIPFPEYYVEKSADPDYLKEVIKKVSDNLLTGLITMAMKVLLVDDEEGILRVLGISLEDSGYEVHTANNGLEASRIVKTLLPDIVLTDIRMPGMDGIELLRFIKEGFPYIEVIMISGHGDLSLAIESLKMDAVDFITKPINNDILEIALKRATDRIETQKKLRLYTTKLEKLVKEKTQRLEASEKRYIQLFNESPSFITLQNKDFKIVESNNRFKEQFGEDPDICCYQVYKKRETPCVGCPVEKTFQDGKSHVAEMDVTLKDGSIRNFLIQTSAVVEPDGQVKHVMEMSTDVTMIHELQDHLAALGLHISSISHGIKGLLTGLDGGDYLISTGIEKQDTELVADGWEIVKEKISMVRQMVLDILYHSKDRALELLSEDVFDFIQELTTTLDPKMKKAGIVLTLDIPKPGIEIPIDKPVFLPAFLAILENAIDACVAVKETKKHLEIRINVTLTQNTAMFKIRDNGKGLARAFQEEVFSLFYSDKGSKGTGLGLFIAKRAVKQHKGVIKVDSIPGEYTEFTISLPIHKGSVMGDL